MDVRGGGAAAEDARVTRAGYESEDDEAARPLRHCDHDMPDAQPHAVRTHGPATLGTHMKGRAWGALQQLPGGAVSLLPMVARRAHACLVQVDDLVPEACGFPTPKVRPCCERPAGRGRCGRQARAAGPTARRRRRRRRPQRCRTPAPPPAPPPQTRSPAARTSGSCRGLAGRRRPARARRRCRRTPPRASPRGATGATTPRRHPGTQPHDARFLKLGTALSDGQGSSAPSCKLQASWLGACRWPVQYKPATQSFQPVNSQCVLPVAPLTPGALVQACERGQRPGAAAGAAAGRRAGGARGAAVAGGRRAGGGAAAAARGRAGAGWLDARLVAPGRRHAAALL